MILGSLDLATLFMLTSAIIHAAIGIILKTSTDKLTFRAVLAVTSALLVFPLIWAVEFPPREALGFLAAGHSRWMVAMAAGKSAAERGGRVRVISLENTQGHALTCSKLLKGSLGHHFKLLEEGVDSLHPPVDLALASMR